jgi:hypothetical protein
MGRDHTLYAGAPGASSSRSKGRRAGVRQRRRRRLIPARAQAPSEKAPPRGAFASVKGSRILRADCPCNSVNFPTEIRRRSRHSRGSRQRQQRLRELRREKVSMPRGGPTAATSGAGGSIYLVAREGVNTLATFANAAPFPRAERPARVGTGHDRCVGEDLVIEVPKGTEVHDVDTGEAARRPLARRRQLLVAKGRRAAAATRVSRQREPRAASVRPRRRERSRHMLALKLLADVGSSARRTRASRRLRAPSRPRDQKSPIIRSRRCTPSSAWSTSAWIAVSSWPTYRG